jgi:alpha-glucoside transport system substrate-binding protein
VNLTRSRLWVPLLAAFTLLSAACLQEDSGGGGGDGGDGEEGGSVTVLGAFTDPGEVDPFEAAIAPFEEETGITVDFEGSREFETLITTRVQGGNAPDIAIFPQPGLLLDIVDQAEPPALEEFLDIGAVEESLVPGFLAAGTGEDGKAYGLPVKATYKSVLWYPVPEFEEAGYAVPTSDSEVTAVEDQIIADGGTPWCLGMESGDATGWVGTDWIEETMLRLHGPDVYDQWVSHEIPFNDPQVKEAFERWQQMWDKEGNVLGGTQGMLSTPFGDSPAPMFEEDPGCYMHRQGDFIGSFFPDEVQEDPSSHVGAAYYPSFSDGFDGDPVLGGGDLALLLNDDNDAAKQLMEFMANADFGGEWAAGGGWLSPHREFDASNYANDIQRQIAEIGANADVLRFDASDLMPGAVGAGSFWTGIVDWVGGQRNLDQVLDEIENSWPADDS